MKYLIILLLPFVLLGNKKKDVESEVVNLDAIKNVIENDNLSKHVQEKNRIAQEKADREKKMEKNKYNFPPEKEFFGFLSELWLIKNISVLKWDFENFLEKIGIINFQYKILLVNTPMITHFALPSKNSEAVLLLSLPFIRTLDLSKLEISLILLEDLVRLEEGYFASRVLTEEMKKKLGTNFFKKDTKLDAIEGLLKKYDKLIYEDGFNFKQQFKVTKKMDRLLKGNLKLWNRYYLMVQKIKELSDTNYLYKHHVKIYPSPELQLNWLKPKQ
jgi:hypothetical protein